jgi:hypothetical protein
LVGHEHELDAEEQGGIGLTAVRADPKGIRGQLFGPVGFPAISARMARSQARSQFGVGWSSWRASDPMSSMQRSASSMSPAPMVAAARQIAAKKSSTGSPDRSARARASAVRSKHWASRLGTRSGVATSFKTRTMVASSPMERASPTASSASV